MGGGRNNGNFNMNRMNNQNNNSNNMVRISDRIQKYH